MMMMEFMISILMIEALDLLVDLQDRIHITHQTGKTDYETTQNMYKKH